MWRYSRKTVARGIQVLHNENRLTQDWMLQCTASCWWTTVNFETERLILHLHMLHKCISHNNSLPCWGSSGSPQDWGLPCSPGGFSDPMKTRLTVSKKNKSLVLFSCDQLSHSLLFISTLKQQQKKEKKKKKGEPAERFVKAICSVVSIGEAESVTWQRCKLRTSLTAQFPLLLCSTKAELTGTASPLFTIRVSSPCGVNSSYLVLKSSEMWPPFFF